MTHRVSPQATDDAARDADPAEVPVPGGIPSARRRPSEAEPVLAPRQELVLRAIVARYVGDAAPVGSRSVSEVLPVPLSAASIRNTMAELAELGLVEKPHRSAGRVPTAAGLRVFVDQLLAPRGLDDFERRELSGSVGDADPAVLARLASRLLSERTHQLGFALAPRTRDLVLRHVSLVRLSTTRVLVVLVGEGGHTYRRVVEDEESGAQPQLDRLAGVLSERVAGRPLSALREELAQEVATLASRAHGVLERALWLGWRALQGGLDDTEQDLVVATWLALLDQPEFRDAERLRQVMAALETKQSLLRLVERVLASDGVTVALGDELENPELRRLAFVAAPYGSGAPGVLGVLGPWRMDYPRVVALVGYLSELVTEKMSS